MAEKKLNRYIMPNILAMVGTSCYVLADTYFIAKAAGADGMTALNLVLPIYALIFAIGSMIGIGSATRYSLDKSVDCEDAESCFSNSIFWSITSSIVFVILGIFAPDGVLRFMGADETILNIGLRYTKIVLLFAPFFMLNYTFTAFVRNDNSPNTAMSATLISGGFNIVFDYIFMFPLGMGMPGAALATGLSPVVSMLICLRHYLSKKNTIRLRIKLPSFKKLIGSIKLGLAAFIGEISNGITTMTINFILLDIAGNTAVAVYGIIANIALVGTALLNGVAQGLQPLASEAHGNCEYEEERKIRNHSLKTGIIIAVLLVGLVMVFGDCLVAIFNSENSLSLASMAQIGIRIYITGFMIAAINIIKSGFYSATDNAGVSTLIAVLRGIVAMVFFAFLLSKLFGIVGVWLAFPISEIFTWLISSLFIKKSSVNKSGRVNKT